MISPSQSYAPHFLPGCTKVGTQEIKATTRESGLCVITYSTSTLKYGVRKSTPLQVLK